MLERINAYYLSHPHLIERLLHWLGVPEVQMFDENLRCSCPIHRGRRKANFGVQWSEGYIVWRCFSDSCGRGDLCALVRKVRTQLSFKEAVNALATIAGISFDGASLQVSEQVLVEESIASTARLLGMHAKADATPNIFPEQMVADSMRMLGQNPDQLEYLTQVRQIPIQALAQWQVGLVPSNYWVWQGANGKPEGWFQERISFPWRTIDGRLMGFAGRRTDGIDHVKYKTLPGTRRALMLWGLWNPQCIETVRRTRTIHLVEGYTDVIRGHIHRCYNIAAVGGTELTEQQEQLLKDLGVETIVNFFDGDEAGRNSSTSIGRQVSRFARVLDAVPPDKKDPDDLLTFDSFWQPILEAKVFVPS